MNFYKEKGSNPATETLIASIRINEDEDAIWISNGTFTNTSDARLKTVVENNIDYLNLINNLNLIKFTWKGAENNTEKLGLLAQDLFQIIPEVVHKGDDGVGEIDDTGVVHVDEAWEINYTGLIPYLIGAIQEMSNKIEYLENRLQEIEGV
jgi:hypothetical protein